MEKKKMKLWKKILILIFIILAIFVIVVGRRFFILADLDKKVSSLEDNSTNFYMKTTIKYGNVENSTSERFIKDDVDKFIVQIGKSDDKVKEVIQITYPNERRQYIETEDLKVMHVYEEKAPVRMAHTEESTKMNPMPSVTYSVITNFAYSISIPERIINALFTGIKSVEMDGKQCYELSGKYNSNFIVSENTKEILAYVEKDTGLPVKRVEKIEEDGKIRENITEYEFEFGKVTDEDMKEPDEAQYKLEL